MAVADTLTSADAVTAVPQPGDVIADKYLVESVVASGGMGTVLAAKHLQLGQSIAIKVVRADESKREEAIARFLREGRAAASLESDHVVRIHDLGTLEHGTVFMVMELLRGQDLAHHLGDHGALPIEEAAEYVLQACDAIAEAHSRGIVHRDLKPSNLYLTHRSDGQPLIKVLDFGISKSVRQGDDPAFQANLTSTRSVMGSPAYMSPEQVRDAKKVDHRTDIWSLGVILYELLAGQPAFEGDTLPGVCAAIAADAPRPLRAARPDVPPELEAIVVRCLEKDPNRRFQTVRELVEALAAFAPQRRTSTVVVVPSPDSSLPVPRVPSGDLEPTLRPAELGSAEPPAPQSAQPDVKIVTGRSSVDEAASTLVSPQSTPRRPVPAARASGKWSLAAAGALAAVAAIAWVLWPNHRATSTAPEASAAPAPRQTSFTLLVESTPSAAEIYDDDWRLGETPMLLTVERASVAGRPRLFVLRHPGYEPYSIVQGDSDANVRVMAALVPAVPVPGASVAPPGPRVPPPTKAAEPKRAVPAASGAPAMAPDIRMNR
jgi:serine/threonine-protein kinase